MPHCLICGAVVDEYDSAYYPRGMLCIPCYVRKSAESSAFCAKCGTRLRVEEAKRKGGLLLCNFCEGELERRERLPICRICGQKIESFQKQLRLADGLFAHLDCALKSKSQVFCSFCNAKTDKFKVLPNGLAICATCSKREGDWKATKPSLIAMFNKLFG
ncbi:MAG: hypothetical protein QXN37_03415 [Candidatus Anstonellaceae archaeon]